MSGSDDWQVGDEALCINDRVIECPGHWKHTGMTAAVSRGQKIKVRATRLNPSGCGCSDLIGDGCGWANTGRFIKVTPPEADEFDREVIKLLTSKPAQVSS